MSTTAFGQFKPLLTEADLQSFLREPVSLKEALKPLYFGMAVFFSVLAASYALFNYNALLRVYQTDSVEPVAITEAVATPTPTPLQQEASAAVVVPTPIPTIPKDSISMAGLNISAPVAWDTLFDEKIINEKLPNTTVHFQGTAKPGQHGMVVITGHSSNYPWIKGAYNTIFAPLRKAKAGQTVTLNYDDHEYTYTVTRIYEVGPSDLSVLQAKDQDGLRLVTCTPIGTSLRRLVVEAVQTSPSTDGNAAFTHTEFTGSIPGAR